MLRAKDLVCGYNGKTVLDGIDLSVERGEFLGIIGPNGSGKTTLLGALTRVLEPARGEVSLDGKNIWSIAPKTFAREVSAVSQNAPAVPMTVEEFILLGRVPHYGDLQFLETKKDLGIAEQAMHVTGIEGLRDRLMTRISGGERQLAAIARALAQEPRWLVLDEPTAHLDIAHQVRILDLLAELNVGSNLTVIMVLHDLNLAGEYCRRLLLLHHGRCVRKGSPEEVLKQGILEEVYGTPVVTGKNIVSSRPFVLAVPVKHQERKKIS